LSNAEREIEAAGGSAGVTVERRGPLAIWTIDREARGDRTLRAVILTGAGGQAFCAGADLKERQGMDMEEVRDFLSLYRVCFRDVDSLDKPVIAAIDGVAFGGGLELALACDLRVASRTSQIGLTETSLGIIPGAGGTQRLTRIVGPARAKELVLFARRLSAAEAHALGIVNVLADEGETALERAIRWVEPLLTAAPIAIAASLDAIDASSDLSLEDGLSHERECYERTLVSKDRLEALAAFAAKRKPTFTGE
jgi:methylglutaconyl-CoA hydratase